MTVYRSRVSMTMWAIGMSVALSACGANSGEAVPPGGTSDESTTLESQTVSPQEPIQGADISASASPSPPSDTPVPSTDSPSPSTSNPTSVAPDTHDDFGSAPETGAPSVLPQPEVGSPLTLSDFFNPTSGWSENSFDVAGRTDVKGIGGSEIRCGDASEDSALELRLQNKFDQLEFSVGQSDWSERPDQRLVVRVLGDNEQLDVDRLDFNEMKDFTVSVADRNAVRIEFFLDDEIENCAPWTVQAVVFDASAR